MGNASDLASIRLDDLRVTGSDDDDLSPSDPTVAVAVGDRRRQDLVGVTCRQRCLEEHRQSQGVQPALPLGLRQLVVDIRQIERTTLDLEDESLKDRPRLIPRVLLRVGSDAISAMSST